MFPFVAHPSATRKRLRMGRLPMLLLCNICAPCLASAPASPPSESYTSDFFRAFSPQTALDMVRHLPGFQFDPGDEGIRGFASSGGNVLINGERPATKSGGLVATLSAIPARQVTGIEILRAGAAASEASGQLLLANVVYVGGRKSIAVDAALSRMDGHVMGNASVTLTYKLGDFDASSQTMIDAQGERSHGSRVTHDAGGVLKAREKLRYDTDFPELSERLALHGPLLGGRVKLGAMLARAWLSEAFTFSDESGASHYPKRTTRWRGEASAEWSRVVAGDYLAKLIAMQRSTKVDGISLSQSGPNPASLETTDRFQNRSIWRETIFRATVARQNGTWQPELGSEVAWNSLDSWSSLQSQDETSPAVLPGSDVLVRERRIDAFATITWRPDQRWATEAGLSYEMSRISAAGDATGGKSLGFLKPHMTILFKPDGRSDLRISLKRTIGQLAFGDFASSINLAEGTASAGNGDLKPDHSFVASFDYTIRFGKRGAFDMSAGREWRRDVLEPTVLSSGGFAMVNVPRARAWNVAANLELPTDGLVPHGLFKLSFAHRRSHLIDPLLGGSRPLNNSHPTDVGLSFRQDFAGAQISWGADYSRRILNRSWYADQAREQHHSREFNLFVETTRFLDCRIRLEMKGLGGIRNRYDAFIFTPDRRSPLDRHEIWDIRSPTAARLSLARTF